MQRFLDRYPRLSEEVNRHRIDIASLYAAFVRWWGDDYTPVAAAVWMAHLATAPWCAVVLFHLRALEWSPLAESLAQLVRLLVIWLLLRSIVKGRSWSWAATIVTALVYCVVLTFWTALTLPVYLDPNTYSFAGPGPTTIFDLFLFRAEVLVKILVMFVILPWLGLGGMALALWHAWESFGIERHQRYRRLVMSGIPFAALSVLVDGKMIVEWLSIPR